MSLSRNRLNLALWIASLGAALVVLVALGNGTLALPVFTTGAWSAWLKDTDTATVIFALLRVVAMVACAYVLLTTLLVTAASVFRVEVLASVANAVALPFSRQLVRAALGISMATVFSIPASAQTLSVSDDVPTLYHLQPEEVAVPVQTTPVPTVPAAPEPAPIATVTLPNTHEVSPGENLWTIAASRLEQTLGRTPTAQETRAYWVTVVQENRTKLRNPAYPNLIYPGQVLDLPA